MTQTHDDDLCPALKADVWIDPQQEPVLAKKWAAMLRKHGSAEKAMYALLPLHEEQTTWGDVDPEIYDLTESTVINLRLPKAVLRDLRKSAQNRGVEVEQEMRSRLGFDLPTKDTLL